MGPKWEDAFLRFALVLVTTRAGRSRLINFRNRPMLVFTCHIDLISGCDFGSLNWPISAV
jgi:hypothetical protein